MSLGIPCDRSSSASTRRRMDVSTGVDERLAHLAEAGAELGSDLSHSRTGFVELGDLYPL